MTANQAGPRSPGIVQAVRRAARALKAIQDQQNLMWEGFWRSGRFPDGHGDRH